LVSGLGDGQGWESRRDQQHMSMPLQLGRGDFHHHSRTTIDDGGLRVEHPIHLYQGAPTMTPLTARAVSIALLGGAAAVLFATQGLVSWVAVLGWGGYVAAGGDSTALKRTIAAGLLGALLAWVALLIRHQFVVPPDSWLWMPRAGIAVAVTLFVLGMATKVDLFSHLPSGFIGYAAVFGTFAIPDSAAAGQERLMGLHLYNPFIQASLSLVAGAVLGAISVAVAGVLSKK
jgi:hypothetical protein